MLTQKTKLCLYDASNVLFLLLTTITIFKHTRHTSNIWLSDLLSTVLHFIMFLTGNIQQLDTYNFISMNKRRVQTKQNKKYLFLIKYLQIGVYIIVNLSLKNLERTNRQEDNLVKLSDVKIVTKGLLCPFSKFNNFQLPHLESIIKILNKIY